jgi:hypothetical protein
MAGTRALGDQASALGPGDLGPMTGEGRRFDPRLDPPTRAHRRKFWAWVAFLTFCPICVAVVLWAAFDLNGNYPTVQPPVPHGWQSVPGIYASFSAPKNWSLNQVMSDAAGDIFYSGPGGGAGESVTQAGSAPSPARALPAIVGTFLGRRYQVIAKVPITLRHATVAWRYRFHLAGGGTGLGIMAWVSATQSDVWLVVQPASSTTGKILSTLTLAS